jgi:hypothetical protein
LNTQDQLCGCISVAGLNNQMIKRGEPVYLGRLLELRDKMRPLLPC